MRERILVDTGPIVAIFSPDDAAHDACATTLRTLPVPLWTCWPVITEAAYLLRKRPKSLGRLLASFDGGLFAVIALEDDDITPIAAIMSRYESLGLQLADAALLHLADREGIRTLFTLDRRDFSVVRLERGRVFRLIPEAEKMN